MAKRKLIVEVVGDSHQLDRTFAKATASTKHFDKEASRSFRGVAAGSGAFRSLGRSIAFASGTFLGFATAASAIRSSIEAAQQEQVALRSVAAQLKASGLAFDDYRGNIEKVTGSMTRLGIENTQALGAFTILFRASNNVTKALRDLQLAADIAGARHIDLQKAALLVGKVETGNTGILRRYGVQVSKNASVEQALAVARRRFAGQAAANVTPQQKLAAILKRTEEIVGNALLPTLNRYVGRLADWLQKMNASGNLQRDVNHAMDAFSGFLAAARDLLVPLAKGASRLAGALGGWKTTLELATGAFVGFKVAGVAAATAVEFANIAAAAGTAAAWRAALIATGFGALAVAAGIAAAYIITHWDKVKGFFRTFWRYMKATGLAAWEAIKQAAKTGVFVLLQYVTSAIRGVLKAASFLPFIGGKAKAALDNLNSFIRRFKPDWSRPANAFRDALKKAVHAGTTQGAKAALAGIAPGLAGFKPAPAAAGGGGRADRPTTTKPRLIKEFTLPLRLQLAQAKADVTATINDNLKVARQVIAYIRRLIASGRLSAKALIGAYGELASAQGVLTDAHKAAVQKARDAAEKQKQAVANHAEALKKAADKQAEAMKKAAEKTKATAAALAQKLKEATDQARQQIGEIFHGPILEPVDKVKVDPAKLVADLRAQTSAFLNWIKDLNKLAQAGLSPAGVKELRDQGLGAAQQVHALATASPDVIASFVKAFRAREAAISKVAQMTVQAKIVNIVGPRGRLGGGAPWPATLGVSLVPQAPQPTVNVELNIDGHHAGRLIVPPLHHRARQRAHRRRGRHAGTTLGLA